MEGYPYGYHNFIYTWIDTKDQNLPYLIPSEFVPIAFDIVGSLLPSAIDSIALEGINLRLGTSGLNMKQLTEEAAQRNMTITDVMAMPEQDSWIYSDGPSYVCSCFVVAIWKEAGVLDDMELNANEFTPKDVYELDVFNTTAVLPEQCTRADPDLPYCQILGKYKYTLPTYSTITPYPHMNEHCPSEGPDYIRTEGC